MAKFETEKSAKSPSTNNTKCLCESTCYAVTITSSLPLAIFCQSLLSLNSIAGAVTQRMLSKQKNSTHNNSHQDYFLLKSSRQRIACTEDCFKYMEMSIAPRGKRYIVSPTCISTQHREYQASIISTCRLPFSS